MNMSIAYTTDQLRSVQVMNGSTARPVQWQPKNARPDAAQEQSAPATQTLNAMDKDYRIKLKIERQMENYILETELKYYKYQQAEMPGKLLDTQV
ncbi:hypothetical protein [Bowmanella denitrificans]|uniref:hypothetical protein n=1 Tax=Bowmanella denitrificans TaxID=366582 RepID=UPI000C9BB698|nr:hypothetical protein [Bowmanella denitrificans]